MLKIDSEKTIHCTRGDAGTIVITANDNGGNPYTFQVNDTIRLKVMEKNNPSSILLNKEVKVLETSTSVSVSLTSSETKIGDLINKPSTYWYEVELNPDTSCNTLIGYDEDGAKLFMLYPEANEG